MDEDRTPERAAGDAAVAGSGAPSDAGSSPWRRVGDAVGEPSQWSAGFGAARDDVGPGEGRDAPEAAGRPPRLLDVATAASVDALRAVMAGPEPGGAGPVSPGVVGWQLSGGQVLAGFADIGEIRARLEVLEQVLLGEVLSRGLAAEAGFSVLDYTRQALGARAPLPEVTAVAAAVTVAQATTTVTGQPGARAETCAGAERVREAVYSTALPVGRAAQIVRFAQQVSSVTDESDLAEWVAGFVVGASDRLPTAATDATDDADDAAEGAALREQEAPGAARGVDAKLLARRLREATALVKPAKDLEDDERRGRLARSFSRTDGGCSATGLASYRLILDPEGAAIVDSAVSALSAPRRLQDGALEPGELVDPRSAATRRADALLDLVNRAVAAGGSRPRRHRQQQRRPRHRPQRRP